MIRKERSGSTSSSRQSSLQAFLPKKALVMIRKTGIEAPLLHAAPAPELRQISEIESKTVIPSSYTESLADIAQDLTGCTRCKLSKSRQKIVLGEGDPHAALMFVGEGPGEQEDESGRPFVGRAGQLLDKMIEAMGLSRSQVFIANIVKCRPPENRLPEDDEVATCSPFLLRQIAAVRPQVIVALGKCATQTLLQTEAPISSLRGKFVEYSGAQLMPTFHPSYLLRNPAAKKEVWEDLQAVAAKMGIQIPKKSVSREKK